MSLITVTVLVAMVVAGLYLGSRVGKFALGLDKKKPEMEDDCCDPTGFCAEDCGKPSSEDMVQQTEDEIVKLEKEVEDIRKSMKNDGFYGHQVKYVPKKKKKTKTKAQPAKKKSKTKKKG